MTNDPPGGMPGRRPPTIDVIASEIESWPVTKESSRPSDAAVASADAPSSPDVAASPAAPEEPAAAPSAEDSRPPGASPRKTSPPPRQGTGPLGLIGAGLLGGAMAAAIALFLVDRLPLHDNGTRGLDARLARAEQQLREVAAHPQIADPRPQLDELAARLARLEAAPVAPAGAAAPTIDPALVNRVSRIEGELKALDEKIGLIGRRSDEAATQAREARQRAEANTTAIAELAQKLPGQPSVSRSDHEALAARVAELAKKPPDGSDRAVRLALVATLLRRALERGEPFADELTAARALGVDPKPLAPLEPFAATGVPGGAALGRELIDLAPALLAATGNAPREGSFLERLQANAAKIVRIRPVEEVAGDDAAAIITRIEVKAGRGDLAGALVELRKLPAPTQAIAEPWVGKAEARLAALDAGRRFAAGALGGIGK
jgi:hypothetical protein